MLRTVSEDSLPNKHRSIFGQTNNTKQLLCWQDPDRVSCHCTKGLRIIGMRFLGVLYSYEPRKDALHVCGEPQAKILYELSSWMLVHRSLT